MKTYMALILTLVLLITTGPVIAEEMAKEGSVPATVSYSSSLTVMAMGKDAQYTFDALGVLVTDSPDNLFNNSSVRILGSGLYLKGAYTELGSMCLTLPSGEQIFAIYKGKSVEGKLKANFTYTGGTEKFTGITGGGELERFNVPKPATKGTVQGYVKWMGNSWKLP